MVFQTILDYYDACLHHDGLPANLPLLEFPLTWTRGQHTSRYGSPADIGPPGTPRQALPPDTQSAEAAGEDEAEERVA